MIDLSAQTYLTYVFPKNPLDPRVITILIPLNLRQLEQMTGVT